MQCTSQCNVLCSVHLSTLQRAVQCTAHVQRTEMYTAQHVVQMYTAQHVVRCTSHVATCCAVYISVQRAVQCTSQCCCAVYISVQRAVQCTCSVQRAVQCTSQCNVLCSVHLSATCVQCTSQINVLCSVHLSATCCAVYISD